MAHTNKKTNLVPRRSILKAFGAVGTASLVAPSLLRAQDAPLKIGVYGGYFQETFNAEIFPEFTAATGIEVESIAEPTGEAWVIQLQQAARAGHAPADVSMIAQAPLLRGIATDLWAPLDEARIPEAADVFPHLLKRNAAGHLVAVGAVSWYISLVTNTDVFPEAPTSWAELWDPSHENQLGLLANVSNSYLLEVTAKTFFGGTDYLSSDENILEVLAKVAELKPNVYLWYRDEAQFEQALKSGEIPMGQYYHDVTGLAAKDGFPVRSTIPKEGAIMDSGSWAITHASQAKDRGEVFINYMSQPAIQAHLARVLGSAPTVPRELTDLTDEEFAAVASDIEPIVPVYGLYVDKLDWLNQVWTEMQQS